MKQASRDTGPMRGCAHLGFVSRPAPVQPPRMRVGQKPRSRHGGNWCLGEAQASPTRKGPYRWKAPRIAEVVRWSRSSGRNDLGGSRPGGPTRRRERQVRRKPERERRQGCQRLATWAASVDKIPGSVINPRNRGECGTPKRRKRCACAPPPPVQDGGSQNPSSRARRKLRGQRREPTSTGNRSREFGKQTSDERIESVLI